MYAEKVAVRYDPQQQSSVGGHHPPQHSQKLASMKDGKLLCNFRILYRLYRENGQFMPQELFPLFFLAPRVLNLSCRHYYLSENI